MGIREDLQERFYLAHEARTCVLPQSSSDARRLRAACSRGEVVAPAPGVYTLASAWDSLRPTEREVYRARALSQLHPDWVFASFTAAAVHGLAVTYRLFGPVHVACNRTVNTPSTPHVVRHVESNVAVEVVDGVRVTSLPQTVFDCTGACGFYAGLAIADSALRVSGLDNARLMACLDGKYTKADARWRAFHTVALADGRAESGGESVARAVMIAHGFMPPDLQVPVRDPVDRENVYRVDFYWHLPTGDVIGELDGHEKYVNPQMTGGKDIVEILSDERRRESRVTGASAKVMRFSYAEVLKTNYFCHVMESFGVPRGYAIPEVAKVPFR